VVNVLLKEKVPATLFLSGRWIEKNIEKTKFLASQPFFEIANHSYYHPHLMEKPDERVKRELVRTQAIIKQETGKDAKYFRPPYGEVNEHVAQLAKDAGLITIQYDIASGDPDSTLSAARISKAILENAGNGSIIVFHMNRKGVHTAELLPDVIHGLVQKGFTLVTIGELLNEKGIHQGRPEKSMQKTHLSDEPGKSQTSSPSAPRREALFYLPFPRLF